MSKHRVLGLVGVLGLLSVAVGACDLIASVDRSKIGAQGGAAPGGSGGAGGLGGTVGGGGTGGDTGGTGGTACDPANCPPSTTVCATAACIAGQCDFDPEPAGTVCAEGNGVQCDGLGACVECLDAQDCTDPTLPVCLQGACVPVHCENGTYDPADGETDVDCGGADCPTCANGDGCNLATDCTSNRCVLAGGGGAGGGAAGTCSPCTGNADCASDEYCNGAQVCVPKIVTGQACGNGAQCVSANCIDNVCCATACGGTCQACDVAGALGTCTPIAVGTDPDNECGADVCGGASNCRCANGVKDGAETASDCGGGTCATCANGQACAVGSDCQSGTCVGLVCASPTCGDGFVNGSDQCDGNGSGTPGETATCDVDCTTVSCGDGHQNALASEACDDGDLDPADGCSATCTVELGFNCTGTTPSVCTSTCGDGTKAADEACDDGDI
ncbi:MAG: hypothetical protein IT373_00240, partial [Polyangiaceae bacterium]|nr:hypothetical protein [Polyangiaceae bacterium]